MPDPISQFKAAMLDDGLIGPDHIEHGKIQRFPGMDKSASNKAGWCKLFEDGIGGVYGDYSTGLSATWQAKRESPYNQAERDAFKRQIADAKQQREAEEQARHAEAATKAAEIWQAATPAPADFPYLVLKGIKAHDVRLSRGALVIPMRDSGKIHSLQFIDPDGGKKFLHGGRVTGCYFSIGNPKGAAALCICEGFATGASINEATGYPVAVAFNAGNLEAVARGMRAKFPDLPLIICADDDVCTAGNPGLSKATAAAQTVGGRLAVPFFGTDRPDGATDFNDMAQLCGLEAVQRAIDDSSEPLMGECHQSEENAVVSHSVDHGLHDDERLERLAHLSPIEYDRTREAEAKALGVRAATLDKMVKDRRKDKTETDGIDFDDVEAWPHPVEPAALLSDLSATIKRFIICPEETAHAAALWIVMTWFMDVVQVAPLAVITAPEKRCGKSQLLFLLGRLVHRPLAASNITAAALFRAVDAWKPTLLVDEADAFMKDNEELRGLLNCGHTRDSAYIVRVVGDDHTPKRFNVWGAKALAGIGHLADTIMDRSIVLELRRKLPHEEVMRLRYAEPGLFDDLSSRLARFANDNRETLRRARPDLPASLHDRAQDNWEPLLAIAEIAGKEWPALARNAALKLSGSAEDGGTVGNELLADIQEIIETKRMARISLADLVAELCSDDEKSWSTYNRGKPINPRQVSKRLKSYGISSKTIRVGYETAKGYEASEFKEVFARYLSVSPVLPVTQSQPSIHAGYGVTETKSCDRNKTTPVTLEALETLDCYRVTEKNEGSPTRNVIEVEV